MEQEYLELVSMVIEDQLPLHLFIKLSGVNQDAAEDELARLLPITVTYGTDPKPIYFFKSSEYPNLGKMFHYTKLFTFAKGGSPYKDEELSDYDVRQDSPYVQAAVYDPMKKAFVAGLRVLPLYRGIPFSMSAMHTLFQPNDAFVKTFLSKTLELGQTFILPDVGNLGGQYLFSVMAAIIAVNKNARYLCGKPTIEGRIPDVSKEIISAFAYDAFNPEENPEFNPSGQALFLPVEGVIVPELRSFLDIVHQYNDEVRGIHPELQYHSLLSTQQKRKITEKLVLYYGGALPPMFKFYSVLTEEKGMICLAPSVINPTYTTKAWEFPILLDKTKIASIHKRIVDHYTEIFKDVIPHY
jgi:hypothetical protein